MFLNLFIIILIIQRAKSSFLDDLTQPNIPEDGRLQFCELAKKYNLECIRYNVTTEDGYILGVFNIPGDKCRPVYLQHGFVDCSDTFLVRGNTSLVAFLAKKGYDIWLGNMRGNKHSRAHTSLDPNNLKFWEFTLTEIAIYDVPVIIDFVLIKTGQKRLQAIAHSEGTSAFFAMGAMKPEYNEKVKVLLCLAPVAYLHNAVPPLFPLISFVGKPVIGIVGSVIGHGEFLRNSSALVSLIRVMCTGKLMGYELCVEGFLFSLLGEDREQLEREFFPIALGHYPSGSSWKNGAHLVQIATRQKFAQFDYGLLKNLIVYKSKEPPVYDLSKVTMKIAITAGSIDKLADVKDVQLLKDQLPNVVDYHEMKGWNHEDFVWGKYMYKYLFDYVFEILIKYC